MWVWVRVFFQQVLLCRQWYTDSAAAHLVAVAGAVQCVRAAHRVRAEYDFVLHALAQIVELLLVQSHRVALAEAPAVEQIVPRVVQWLVVLVSPGEDQPRHADDATAAIETARTSCIHEQLAYGRVGVRPAGDILIRVDFDQIRYDLTLKTADDAKGDTFIRRTGKVTGQDQFRRRLIISGVVISVCSNTVLPTIFHIPLQK